jgi:hypothetical protein
VAELLEVRATIRDELSRGLKDIRQELRRTARDARGLGGAGTAGASGLGRLASGVGRLAGMVTRTLVKAFKIGLTAAAAFGAGLTLALGKAIKLAMDAGETFSKFATVFGQEVGQMTSWVTRLSDRFGTTTKDLQDAAALFGVFGQAAGVSADKLPDFSKALVEAALDLQSFHNVPIEDVFIALRSGLAGETEPMRRFGVFLSETAIKAEAAIMGFSGTLTETQKVMIRHRLILKGLGAAHGDLERTAGSLSNQWRGLKGRVTELMTVIGTGFVPTAEKLVGALNRRLGPAIARVRDMMPGLRGAFEAGMEGFGGRTLEAMSTAERVAFKLGTWLDRIGVAMSRIGTAGAAGGFQAAWSAFKLEFKDIAPEVGEALKAALESFDIGGFLARSIERLPEQIPVLVTALTNMLNKLPEVLNKMPLGDMIAGLTSAFVTLMVKLDWFRIGWAVVSGLVKGVVDAFMQDPIGFLTTLIALIFAPTRLIGVLGKVLSKIPVLGPLLKGFLGWFKGLTKPFEAGLGNWFKTVLRTVVDKLPVPGFVKAFLKKALVPTEAVGDAPRPMARGGGLRHTLGTHALLEALTPGRRTVTSAVRSWGLGSPGSDHPAGKALDLKGPWLNTYARNARMLGAFAAHHGGGPSRHLHAAFGDAPRGGRGGEAALGGGPALVVNGPLVAVENVSSEVDLERAVVRAMDKVDRLRAERAHTGRVR